MVIPVGPPGAQRILKIVKGRRQTSTITVARSDIYNGRVVPFVPFTKLEGDVIAGTHNNNDGRNRGPMSLAILPKRADGRAKRIPPSISPSAL